MLVGITGMPGSGKSTFSKLLSQYWGVWLDMDKFGHQALTLPSVISKLVEAFGSEILNEDGIINRAKLGKLVFFDKRLPEINQICHPVIRELLIEKVSQPLPLGHYYIQDAAILFEAGFDDLCDVTMMIKTPFQERLKRVAESRNWTEKELLNRDASQNEDLKTKLSDYIIPGEWNLSTLGMKACQLDIAFRYNLATGIQISKAEIFQGKHS